METATYTRGAGRQGRSAYPPWQILPGRHPVRYSGFSVSISNWMLGITYLSGMIWQGFSGGTLAKAAGPRAESSTDRETGLSRCS